jgi:hypothetical protein
MRSIAPILCKLTAMLTSVVAPRCYGEPPAAARLISSGDWAMFTANHWASSTVRPASAPRSSLPSTENRGDEAALCLDRLWWLRVVARQKLKDESEMTDSIDAPGVLWRS